MFGGTRGPPLPIDSAETDSGTANEHVTQIRGGNVIPPTPCRYTAHCTCTLFLTKVGRSLELPFPLFSLLPSPPYLISTHAPTKTAVQVRFRPSLFLRVRPSTNSFSPPLFFWISLMVLALVVVVRFPVPVGGPRVGSAGPRSRLRLLGPSTELVGEREEAPKKGGRRRKTVQPRGGGDQRRKRQKAWSREEGLFWRRQPPSLPLILLASFLRNYKFSLGWGGRVSFGPPSFFCDLLLTGLQPAYFCPIFPLHSLMSI